MEEKPFDRHTHCIKCQRFIDEDTVRLKRITIGPDTYRHYDDEHLNNIKYEKLCIDCHLGKVVV